eukprot:jgi/Hompol1/588/HPOL_004259-RA
MSHQTENNHLDSFTSDDKHLHQIQGTAESEEEDYWLEDQTEYIAQAHENMKNAAAELRNLFSRLNEELNQMKESMAIKEAEEARRAVEEDALLETYGACPFRPARKVTPSGQNCIQSTEMRLALDRGFASSAQNVAVRSGACPFKAAQQPATPKPLLDGVADSAISLPHGHPAIPENSLSATQDGSGGCPFLKMKGSK